METIVETTKMSTKGQVIIPKDVRNFMDVENDTIFTVLTVDKNTLVLQKLDKGRVVREFQKIRAQIKNKLSEQEVNALVHKTRKN